MKTDALLMTDAHLAEMCKALGHPARIKILRLLLEEKSCICGRIVEVIPLAQSTVSQHLKVLKDTGLIRGEIDGPKMCYCIDRVLLTRLSHTLETLNILSEERCAS